MSKAFAASHTTIEQFQRDYADGYWLTGQEAARASGRTAQRISDAAIRPGSKFDCLELGSGKYYHISWIADKWPDGPGSRAFLAGVDSYREWVQQTLIRVRNGAAA